MLGGTDERAAERASRIVWRTIFGLLAVVLLAVPFTNVTIEPLPFTAPFAVGLALAGAGRYYARRRSDPKIAAALDCMGQSLAFPPATALASYLVVTLGFPMQDAAFHRLDLALGLDWRAMLGWLDRNAWLAPPLTFAYKTYMHQGLVLTLLLCFCGRGMAARSMILAMIMAGVVTVVLSGLMPAVSIFEFLKLTPADYPNLRPAAGLVHLPHVLALHSGEAFVFDTRQTHGIITFPSYHAALGLIMLLAAWSHPLLRWPFFVLNAAMIVATPIDGGHYFIDVLAGLAIAALAHVLARRVLAPRTAERYEPRPAAQAPAFAKT
ncbi:MAG TPA: phosphatase PAP2 family protein [Bosea sp. (in: a-proteobacteria)]|jgi:membrane-associated phospholipid phosphatase|uniref:phosphatase PAP2 family protein n=1 Tax=Bosea sp. (in: a-proteobacteria) TaxID=1871050 RepID=UPI002E0E085F|nr:phosphatase PAP2 family protein [Bosea sp. (in: a-proteobacteria)]